MPCARYLLAGKEFGDRLRSGCALACGGLARRGNFTSLFGLVQIGHIGLQGYERTVVSLLNLVHTRAPAVVCHDLVVGT